jgi:hypothetical protein
MFLDKVFGRFKIKYEKAEKKSGAKMENEPKNFSTMGQASERDRPGAGVSVYNEPFRMGEDGTPAPTRDLPNESETFKAPFAGIIIRKMNEITKKTIEDDPWRFNETDDL